MKLVLLLSVAAVGGGVVAASTVSNIVGFGSTSGSNGGWDPMSNETNACVDEDYVRLDERRSLERCFLQCTRYNYADGGSEYKDTQEARNEGGSATVWTWLDVAVLALIWYGFFAVELRQKALLLALLLVIGYEKKAVATLMGGVVAGAFYSLVMAFGDESHDEDYFDYDIDEAFYNWEDGPSLNY